MYASFEAKELKFLVSNVEGAREDQTIITSRWQKIFGKDEETWTSILEFTIIGL